MANENENEKKVSQDTPPVVSEKKDILEDTENFIKMADKVKKAKENSVSKEEYDKMVAAKERLEGYILEGKELEKKADETQKKDIATLTKELKEPELTNLEYISKALELRKCVIEKEGRDPFASSSEDSAKAQKVADTLGSWIEESRGDPAIFNAILESRVKDDPTVVAALSKLRSKKS